MGCHAGRERVVEPLRSFDTVDVEHPQAGRHFIQGRGSLALPGLAATELLQLRASIEGNARDDRSVAVAMLPHRYRPLKENPRTL
jgi:hypothetical protein